MTQYQVVAECAHATVNTPQGPMIVLLMKGAMVPADAPQLQHLLDNGFVAKAGPAETGGVDAAGIPAAAYTAEVPAGLTTTPVPKSEEQKQADADATEKAKADADVVEKRAAARAKLPEDGSAPDGRAGQPVWVEYLAARGYDYAELAKQDKAELQKLAQQS